LPISEQPGSNPPSINPSAQDPEPEIRPSPFRWVLIGLAFAATTINYLDRQTLSVVAPVLQRQLPMNSQEYGLVVAAFMLAYTIMNGLWGPVIDRLGYRAGYLLSVLWWSCAEVLHVFACGPVSLAACRFLLGAGEAGNWPAAVRVVAEWFPARERALASGIFNSGSAFGAIVAPPVVAWITLQYGWRWAFGVMGSLGVLWAVAWISFRYRAAPVANGVQQSPVPTSQLLKSRLIWQFTLSKVFCDPVWYFYTFWFPQYLSTARGFSLKEIGATAWIPFVAADIGNVVGGVTGGWILPRASSDWQGRKLTIILFSLLMTAGIPAVLVHSSAASIALASVVAFGYTGALSNMLALPADVYPRTAVASVWGIASMGAGFGGMLFGAITGWLVQHWSFQPAFILFGIMPLIAAALVWYLPEREPASRS
jgi:ACS family hexuronate transporter-like MFS transporter